VELNPYNINYQPRTMIKRQVPTDFMAEFTPRAPTQSDVGGEDSQRRRGSNSRGASVGVVLTTPEGFIIEQSFTLSFLATNNKAKDKAVIVGLRMAATLEITGLEVCCDSTLVVCQDNGEYAAKGERMEAYLQLVLSLKAKFSRCDFKRVSRSENNHADSLAN